MKIERLRADLEKARQKAVEWQARAKDIERQITEHENLEIIHMGAAVIGKDIDPTLPAIFYRSPFRKLPEIRRQIVLWVIPGKMQHFCPYLV